MLNLMELAALGFASYRGTQLIVWDTILDPWRARLETWHMDGIRPGRSNRVRAFIRALLACTYCTGWWVSLAAVAAYLSATRQWHQGFGVFVLFGIEVFAVAGVQALLNRIDDVLPGHNPDGGN